jgi:hypothetical protein
MSLPKERPPFKEPSSPIGRMQLGLAALFITASPTKKYGDGDQFVDDKPFIDERKPSSMTVAKGNFNNGEHTLISVMVKMIHSAVWECKRLVLKDGRPLHMVKFVDAVRNFGVNTKYVQIDVEDGTGLVWVILWKKERECMAQHRLMHECNSNCYICVIGEVEDYYGVHKIIAFDVRPVSSGNEVTHHFLEVAYSFRRRLNMQKIRCWELFFSNNLFANH